MPSAKKNALRKNPRRKNPSVSWEAYERLVRDVLESDGGNVGLRVEGKRSLKAPDGEWEVDAYAELTVFGGAVIKIIVECKHHTKAVGRHVVESLFARLLSLGAHKGMIFSTSGFQRAAITYARGRGIALVRLEDRGTKHAAYCVAEPPIKYATLYLTSTALLSALLPDEPDDVPEDEPAIVCVLRSAHRPSTVIGSENPRAFREWLLPPPSRQGPQEPPGAPRERPATHGPPRPRKRLSGAPRGPGGDH